MKVTAAYSDKRPSKVRAEEPSCKLGIGVEKLKVTLNVMIQKNARTSILPMTKRYWTGLLSKKLRRLSVKFYTDNLFADDTYMWDHNCAHIYADGYRFYMYS